MNVSFASRLRNQAIAYLMERGDRGMTRGQLHAFGLIHKAARASTLQAILDELVREGLADMTVEVARYSRLPMQVYRPTAKLRLRLGAKS